MFGRAGIITTMTFCIELALGVSIVGDCQNTVSFSILILIFSTENIVVYISIVLNILKNIILMLEME